MTCKVCGREGIKTIKAHLIPRVFCVEVKDGTSFAANLLPGTDSFEKSQSGVWDNTILCHDCDGKLGSYEGYTDKILERIRNESKGTSGLNNLLDSSVDHSKLMRCCAGILLKFSLTTAENGQIKLGRYQDICREIAFGHGPISTEFDIIAIRLKLHEADSGVFVYRNPKADRKFSTNCYRLLIGGVLFFIKLDKRPFQDKVFKSFQSEKATVYQVAPAQLFEEFTEPYQMIQNNHRLSTYLDKLKK